jgi:hypothetical protein
MDFEIQAEDTGGGGESDKKGNSCNCKKRNTTSQRNKRSKASKDRKDNNQNKSKGSKNNEKNNKGNKDNKGKGNKDNKGKGNKDNKGAGSKGGSKGMTKPADLKTPEIKTPNLGLLALLKKAKSKATEVKEMVVD